MLQYGKSEEGKTIHISEAVKSELYTCSNCGDELIVVKGSKKQWHFRHRHKDKYKKGCLDVDIEIGKSMEDPFLYEWYIGKKTKRGDIFVGRTVVSDCEPNINYNEEIIGCERI